MQNHFRKMKATTIFLVMIICISCKQDASISKMVDETTYQSIDKCWIDNEGNFASFMILFEFDSGYVPYFISPFCHVEKHNQDITLGGVHALKFLSDEGLFKRSGFLDKTILTNTNTDIKMNGPKKIYIFSGKIQKSGYSVASRIPMYRISSITRFRPVDMNDVEFGRLDADDRMKLFKGFVE